MTDDTPRGLTCYVPGGGLLVCEACDIREQHATDDAAQVAWSLHVLREHWEQAGMERADRDALLRELTEAMR